MDTNLGDALPGLLLLYGGSDSNNDSKDSSMTHTTNDSDATPTLNNGSSTPISNAGSMDMTPTPLTAEMKRRKYKEREGTSFKYNKAPKVQECGCCRPSLLLLRGLWQRRWHGDHLRNLPMGVQQRGVNPHQDCRHLPPHFPPHSFPQQCGDPATCKHWRELNHAPCQGVHARGFHHPPPGCCCSCCGCT
jgi:hypothetical protein